MKPRLLLIIDSDPRSSHKPVEAVRIAAGARLVVSVGATSLGQPSGNPLYAADVPAGASITIGRETLRLSVLKRAVSR